MLVGVIVGVLVGVVVGVFVLVGVFVGVIVGVFVGVFVGVLVGVSVGKVAGLIDMAPMDQPLLLPTVQDIVTFGDAPGLGASGRDCAEAPPPATPHSISRSGPHPPSAGPHLQ